MKNIIIKNLIFEKRSRILNDYSIISEHDLISKYVNGYLLNESYNIKAQILLENWWQGFKNAFSWITGKTIDIVGFASGSPIALSSVGVDARFLEEELKIILFRAIEKIPGGEFITQILTTFSLEMIKDIKEKIGQTIQEYIENFIGFLRDQKEGLLNSFINISFGEEDILKKVKTFFADQKDEASKKISETLKTLQKGNILEKLALGRGVIAKFVSVCTSITLKSNKSDEILNKWMDKPFFKGPAGKLFSRIITIMAINPESKYSDEDTKEDPNKVGFKIFKVARNIWITLRSLFENESDTGNIDEAFRDELKEFLPDVIEGLVSGDSTIEKSIKAALGDPEAPVALLKSAIKLIFTGIQNIVIDALENWVKDQKQEGTLSDKVLKKVTVVLSTMIEKLISPIEKNFDIPDNLADQLVINENKYRNIKKSKFKYKNSNRNHRIKK